jgi:hypothetical protein
VTRFFEEVDAAILRHSIKDMREELGRVHQILKSHGFDRRLKRNDEEFANKLFSEIVRTRETVVRFSEPRVVLTKDPKAELTKIYGRYIERNFISKEYRERVLERRLKRIFIDAKIIDRYAQERIGDEHYHVTFPFVQKRLEKPIRIIKPLNIAEGEPSKIIERGGQWAFRVRELRKRNLLPDNVLFTIDDKAERGNLQEAYEEAREVLANEEVEVLELGKEEQIIEFATSV